MNRQEENMALINRKCYPVQQKKHLSSTFSENSEYYQKLRNYINKIKNSLTDHCLSLPIFYGCPTYIFDISL